eukprot:TRINITY_DN3687_c0_g1_i5.p1 TRINITY_DN3687_c0_g1~~TRINITY_DN3687_c0_g1_i5.p1  ORF type:complete len:575 (-),score=83.42 TRINITY_DN3687_c0_g1_i5:425-2077(-)
MENWQCLQPGIFYGQQNDADALSELLKVTDTLFQAPTRITADVGVAKQAQIHRPEPEQAWSGSINYDCNMPNQQSRISRCAPYKNEDYQSHGQSLSDSGCNVGFHHSAPPGLTPPSYHQQTHGAHKVDYQSNGQPLSDSGVNVGFHHSAPQGLSTLSYRQHTDGAHDVDYQSNGRPLSDSGFNVGFHHSVSPGLAPPMYYQQTHAAYNVDYQSNGRPLSDSGVNVGFHHSTPPDLAPPVHHLQTRGASWEYQLQNNYNMSRKQDGLSANAIRAAVAQVHAMNFSHSHHGSHDGSQHSDLEYHHEQTSWSTTCSPHHNVWSAEHSYDSTMFKENDFNDIDSDSDADLDPLMSMDFARRSGDDSDEEVEVLLGPTQMIGSPARLDELVLPPAGCGVNLENGVDATQGRKLRSSNSACALSDVIWLSDIAELDLGRTKEAPISFGSIVHLSSSYSKNCRPCIFEKRLGRCVRGKGCEFCHLHAGQRYRPLTSGKSDRRSHHSTPCTSLENSWSGYQSNGHVHSRQGGSGENSWQGYHANAAVHSNQSVRSTGF